MSVTYQSETVSDQVSPLRQGMTLTHLGLLYLEYTLSTFVAEGKGQPMSAGLEATFLLVGKEFRVCSFSAFHPSVLYAPTCFILSGALPWLGEWWQQETLGCPGPEPCTGPCTVMSSDMLSAGNGQPHHHVYLCATQNSGQPEWQSQRGRPSGPEE